MSERESERARGTQIERETNRRTRTRPRPRTRKCRLNQNACKNIVFSFVPALFTVFPFDSFLNIYFLFFMHFILHLPVACAQLKLASASSGSSSATAASISLIQIVCARQRRLLRLRCNCIVIQFKICVLCFSVCFLLRVLFFFCLFFVCNLLL